MNGGGGMVGVKASVYLKILFGDVEIYRLAVELTKHSAKDWVLEKGGFVSFDN